MDLMKWAETGWPDRRFFESIPEINLLRNTPQDPIWHPEGDAFKHTVLVVAAMRRIVDRKALTGKARQIKMLAALYHDVGKYEWEVTNGRYTSRNHAQRSAAFVAREFPLYGVPEDVTKAVEVLCYDHMNFVSTPRGLGRMERRLAVGGMTIRDLLDVQESDAMGRGFRNKVLSSEFLQMRKMYEDWRSFD